MKRKIYSALMSFVLLFTLITNVHAQFTYDEQVEVMYVGNSETGEVFYQKQDTRILPVASMSKLMTYLVAMDEVKKGNISLEDDVKITKEAAFFNAPDNSRFELNTGDVVKLKDLLKGLMIVSGNDAAEAIAIHTAGNSKKFVNMMNEKAKEIGLENSKYINPSGLTEKKGENLIYNQMTARDLFKLASHILKKHPEVKEYGLIEKLKYPERKFEGKSTLPLRDNPAMIGLKTGYTDEAGYGFVGLFDMSKIDGKKNYYLLTVVNGADDQEMRAKTTKELLDYVQNNYINREIINSKVPFIEYADNSVKDRYIPLYAEKDIREFMSKDADIDIEYSLNEEKKAPYENGEVLGEIIIKKNGKEVERVNLITKNYYPKLSFFEGIVKSIQKFFDNLLLLF